MRNDSQPQPFEAFIENILRQNDMADALRNIASSVTDDSSMTSAVELILLESSISGKFDPNGYKDETKKLQVESKLLQLKSLLLRNLVDENKAEMQTISLCIKYVQEDWALTNDLVLYLNKINQKYE